VPYRAGQSTRPVEPPPPLAITRGCAVCCITCCNACLNIVSSNSRSAVIETAPRSINSDSRPGSIPAENESMVQLPLCIDQPRDFQTKWIWPFLRYFLLVRRLVGASGGVL